MMSFDQPYLESTLADRYKADGIEFAGGYNIKELYDLGFVEYAKARPNNLKGPIHPVMDLPRWRTSCSMFGREPMTELDENAIIPILRLATAMLLSPGSVAFIHALMYGRRDYQSELSQRFSKTISVLRDSRSPNTQRRAEVEEGLSAIIPHIQFEWGDSEDPEWRAEEAHGETIRIDKGDIQLNGGNGAKTGSGSSIIIDDTFFCTLVGLHGKLQSCRLLNRMLRAQLVLATTICHELVHAINHAVTEPQDVEPFYKDQAINELGFAWQDEVFGGVVNGWDSEYRWPFDLSRFPRPANFAWPWDQENGRNPERQRNFLRYHAPQSFTRYYVPMKWISRMARQTTWDRWGSSEDPTLLHIPKTIGAQQVYFFYPESPESLKDDPGYVREKFGYWLDQWDPTNWSDGEIKGNKQGRLYRKVEKDDESVSTPSDGQGSVQDVTKGIGAYRLSSNMSTEGENKGPDARSLLKMAGRALSPSYYQRGSTESLPERVYKNYVDKVPEPENFTVVPGSPASLPSTLVSESDFPKAAPLPEAEGLGVDPGSTAILPSTELSDEEGSPVYIGMQNGSPIYVRRDDEEDETDAMNMGWDLGSREQPVVIEDSDSDAMDYEEANTGDLLSFTKGSHYEENDTGRTLSTIDESNDKEAKWERPKKLHLSVGGYYVDDDGNRYV